MAEKKPSKYTDRSTIGSPEELDAYGVWVKSEPQDLTAGMAEAVNFDAEAVPYADFDMEFDDSAESNYDFSDLEPEIPEINIEGDGNDNVDDGITPSAVKWSGEEESTRLLMKIADELSAIRSELSTLKKEFVGVRIENVAGAKTADVTAEARHGGFFDGEEGDDEKITLTGDEMENILTSADFSEEEDIGFDAQREADEAALKELSAQNESAAETEEPEEPIEIDFDNLGIKLDDEVEAESHDDFPPLEADADDDLGTSSFDIPSEETQEELTSLESFEPLEPIEEDEELRDLRLEGAVPFTPAPDNSVYLENDPFALDVSGLEETAPEETPFEETVLEEDGLNETTVPEETVETVPQDTDEITTDAGFDDVSFDLNTDDFSTDESLPPLEEEIAEEQTLDVGPHEINIEQTFESPALPEDEISIEQTLESPAPQEETISDEQAFDADVLDFSEAVIDEPDLSAGLVEAPLEEPVLGDISFGDDISLDMDDFKSGIDLDINDSSVDDAVGGLDDNLAIDNLALDIDTDAEPGTEEDPGLDGGLADDLVIDESVELDTEAGDPVGDLADDLVTDDVEANVELDTEDGSPVGDLADDLVTDDVQTNVELDTEDGGPAGDLADDLVIDESVELDMEDGDPAGDLADDLVTDDVQTNVEPDTEDGDLTDDLADDLALDDFGAGIDLDVKEEEAGGFADTPADEPDSGPADSLADDGLDDGLTGVIPEGFEVNAEEAPVSMDDDLEEAFADDLSIDDAALPAAPPKAPAAETDAGEDIDIPANFKSELKSVLSYMDHLLESLPEDKIEEFAKSEYFDSYKKIFKELGLV
jgi:hypothetical protein